MVNGSVQAVRVMDLLRARRCSSVCKKSLHHQLRHQTGAGVNQMSVSVTRAGAGGLAVHPAHTSCFMHIPCFLHLLRQSHALPCVISKHLQGTLLRFRVSVQGQGHG